MLDTKQQQFLDHVSHALGRQRAPKEAPAFDILSRGPQNHMMQNMSQEDIVARFKLECDNVGTKYKDATVETLPQILLEVVRQYDGGDVIYPNMEEMEKWGLRAALEGAGGNIRPYKWDPDLGREENIKRASTASIGITFPLMAIASTATIIQSSFEDSGRSVGLLPLTHVAIVRKSTIMPRMTQTMAKLHELYQDDPAKFPTNVCHISGPSNTADIELIRVVGVHGPINVFFIILDDTVA